MNKNDENSVHKLNEILSNKIVNRFQSYVKKKQSGCWEWQGACNKRNGYGEFRVGDKTHKAHRVAWIIEHKRSIPKGILILHDVCHNAKCVNPSHLKEGSHIENMKGMFDVGRHKDQIAEKKKHFSKAINKLSVVDKKLLYEILYEELFADDYNYK